MQRTLAAILVGFSLLPLAAAQAAKVDFARQVWPVLQQRCVECHAAPTVSPDGKTKRPKGGVVLDNKDGIALGKGGKLAVAGKPEESLLYSLVVLPADDEDRMPPAKHGPALSKAQSDLIRNWIQQGAEFGNWTGNRPAADSAAKPTAAAGPVRPRRGDLLQALQKGLAPLPANALQPFAKGPLAIEAIEHGSPLLRVSCAGYTDLVTDNLVAELLPLAEHIAELDLGRTPVGDASLATIAKMRRLVALDLRQTQVGNHGVAKLVACTELRSLNLFGTKVGDYGATALASMKQLERVYLWQTEVSAAAVKRLQDSVPGIKVVFVAELPEPGEPGTGRRRR